LLPSPPPSLFTSIGTHYRSPPLITVPVLLLVVLLLGLLLAVLFPIVLLPVTPVVLCHTVLLPVVLLPAIPNSSASPSPMSSSFSFSRFLSSPYLSWSTPFRIQNFGFYTATARARVGKNQRSQEPIFSKSYSSINTAVGCALKFKRPVFQIRIRPMRNRILVIG